MENLLSRKFLLSVLIVVAGLVFVLTKNIEYDEFLNLATWILGIYVTGNVATKFSAIVNK